MYIDRNASSLYDAALHKEDLQPSQKNIVFEVMQKIKTERRKSIEIENIERE